MRKRETTEGEQLLDILAALIIIVTHCIIINVFEIIIMIIITMICVGRGAWKWLVSYRLESLSCRSNDVVPDSRFPSKPKMPIFLPREIVSLSSCRTSLPRSIGQPSAIEARPRLLPSAFLDPRNFDLLHSRAFRDVPANSIRSRSARSCSIKPGKIVQSSSRPIFVDDQRLEPLRHSPNVISVEQYSPCILKGILSLPNF